MDEPYTNAAAVVDGSASAAAQRRPCAEADVSAGAPGPASPPGGGGGGGRGEEVELGRAPESSSPSSSHKWRQKLRPLHRSSSPPSFPDFAPTPTPSSARACLPDASAMWHGMGLFGESYLLFSVGTLRPFWEALYPDCFTGKTCDPDSTFRSMTYSVIVGVMAGMIAVGMAANRMGRRRGSIVTASLMTAGAICLTLSSLLLAEHPTVLFPVMSCSLFLFGIGVGGEYPLSASSASERAMMAVRREREEQAAPEEGGPGFPTRTSSFAAKKDAEGGDDGASPATITRLDGCKKGMPRLSSIEECDGGEGSSAWASSSVWASSSAWASSARASLSAYITPPVPVRIAPAALLQRASSPMTNDSLALSNFRARRRGREVLLVFSMQGMGIFVESLVLTFLLAWTRRRNGNAGGGGDGNDDDDDEGDEGAYEYSAASLLFMWRAVYASGAIVLVYVLLSRVSHLAESEVWASDRDEREKDREVRAVRRADSYAASVAAASGVGSPFSYSSSARVGGDCGDGASSSPRTRDAPQWDPTVMPEAPTLSSITMRSDFEGLGSTNLDGCRPCLIAEDTKPTEMQLLFQHYGIRLFGTSASWLLWDVAFYGNKMFQSSFLLALTGEDASLIKLSCVSTINAFVALMGYYAAAFIVDDPDVGRLTLQQSGFMITGTLFLLCSALSDRVSSTWLVLMYFGSSFFGQCGPNCTTFLIPAEIFPTEMRTTCHGISASAGKFGALIASVLFNFLNEDELFLISGYASFAACFITFLFIPETTSLDLHEIDKQWRMILDNRKFEYEGPANDPRYLSFYERNRNEFCC